MTSTRLSKDVRQVLASYGITEREWIETAGGLFVAGSPQATWTGDKCG